jgi:chromosome partitioning protein
MRSPAVPATSGRRRDRCFMGGRAVPADQLPPRHALRVPAELSEFLRKSYPREASRPCAAGPGPTGREEKAPFRAAAGRFRCAGRQLGRVCTAHTAPTGQLISRAPRTPVCYKPDEGRHGEAAGIRSPPEGAGLMNRTPWVASFLNRKGGVGKTSSVFHLAGYYARAGRRVLALDLDPQASLSQGFLGPRVVEALPGMVTVAALFDDACDPLPDDLIHETAFPNLLIVPANNALTPHNTPRREGAGRQEAALQEFVAEVRPHFDVLLIDCPPNLQLCSWAALLASDFVVVPVIPEDFSSQGLIHVQGAIDQARAQQNPRLCLLGYVLTLYNRMLGIHKAYEQLLREEYRDLVLENPFPLSTAFKEAVARRRPISEDRPRSAPAEAIQELALELLDRVPVYRVGPASVSAAGNHPISGAAPAPPSSPLAPLTPPVEEA